MAINHPVIFMQTLQYLLHISTIMVSLYVSWFIQHYTEIICINGCDYPALVCCCVNRHMLIHTEEHYSCVRLLGKLKALIMPFKCMKCDCRPELRASTMPLYCMKCDSLKIYLPRKIYSDANVIIYYINLSVWECRLSEILYPKCQ